MVYKAKDKAIIEIEGAQFQYNPNFSGNPAKNYDHVSNTRHFTVHLEDGSKNMFYKGKPLKIKDLEDDGWNVRPTKPKSKDVPVEKYIDVKV